MVFEGDGDVVGGGRGGERDGEVGWEEEVRRQEEESRGGDFGAAGVCGCIGAHFLLID